MRHSVRARFLQTLACAACLLVLPTPALAAAGSGLHIDPRSPVAKEYALPLAAARGAPPESGQRGKLFGSGIRRAGATSPRTTAPHTVPPAATPAPVPPSAPATEPPATPTTTTTTQAPSPHPAGRQRPHVTTVTLPSLTAAPSTTTAGTPTASATPAAYRVLRPGSGPGLLWMLLAAVVVVVLGSAGGLALRRRR